MPVHKLRNWLIVVVVNHRGMPCLSWHAGKRHTYMYIPRKTKTTEWPLVAFSAV